MVVTALEELGVARAGGQRTAAGRSQAWLAVTQGHGEPCRRPCLLRILLLLFEVLFVSSARFGVISGEGVGLRGPERLSLFLRSAAGLDFGEFGLATTIAHTFSVIGATI